MRTHRRTDMTQLTVAFRNIANAPTIIQQPVLYFRSEQTDATENTSSKACTAQLDVQWTSRNTCAFRPCSYRDLMLLRSFACRNVQTRLTYGRALLRCSQISQLLQEVRWARGQWGVAQKHAFRVRSVNLLPLTSGFLDKNKWRFMSQRTKK